MFGQPCVPRVDGLADALAAVGVHSARTVRRMGGGHIHGTWLVATPTARFVAQRLNGLVFCDFDACEDNLRRIEEHLAGRDDVVVPRLMRGADGRVHVPDRLGNTWRITRYAEGTMLRSAVRSAGQASNAAVAFGRYVAALADLPGPQLRPTIPRFHDFDWRVHQLETAVDEDRVGRLTGCAADVDRIRASIPQMSSLVGLPLRPVHNDAKVANLRFSRRPAGQTFVMDLDTTMPGVVAFDTSELLRTASHDAPEDAVELDQIVVDLRRVEAVIEGFCAGAADVITAGERDAIAATAPRLAVENALRMLTDHLNGDVYYRVSYPGHNLVRARVQAEVARQLMKFTMASGS